MLDLRFEGMGSDLRIVLEAGAGLGAREEEAAARVRRFLERLEACLTRFRSDSELCALNADPRDAVPVSPLLRAGVEAGLWAARRTEGLVDPTLVGELERCGYAHSRIGDTPPSLTEALRAAPARRAARPAAAATWKTVRVDRAGGVVHRPPGVRIDTGGTGKGLAADLAARMLTGAERYAIDCGGDLRVGTATGAAAHAVEVAHPVTGEIVHRLSLRDGAVATSGLNVRVWRNADGGFGHHLLDPATGEPAWTGLIGATALGATALEAETLAKAALLSGPVEGRRVLAQRGGVLVHDDGDIELAGPLRRPVLRVSRSALLPKAAA